VCHPKITHSCSKCFRKARQFSAGRRKPAKRRAGSRDEPVRQHRNPGLCGWGRAQPRGFLIHLCSHPLGRGCCRAGTDPQTGAGYHGLSCAGGTGGRGSRLPQTLWGEKRGPRVSSQGLRVGLQQRTSSLKPLQKRLTLDISKYNKVRKAREQIV